LDVSVIGILVSIENFIMGIVALPIIFILDIQGILEN